MGIKGLLPFLASFQCNTPFAWPDDTSTLRQENEVARKVAIDVPIFAFRYIYKEKTMKQVGNRFLQLANYLKAKGYIAVFVFDGLSNGLELKQDEKQRRTAARRIQESRNRTKLCQLQYDVSVVCNILITDCEEALDKTQESEGEPEKVQEFEAAQGACAQEPDGAQASKGQEEQLKDTHIGIGASQPVTFSNQFGILFPTKEDYKELQIFLQMHMLETHVAKYEAEALCAHLCATDQVWAVLTEDTDALPFGSKRTIFKSNTSEPVLYELDTILHALDLTLCQFQTMCILFGCDFCKHVHLLGPKQVYKLIKKYKTWPSILEEQVHLWNERTKTSATTFDKTFKDVLHIFQSRAYEVHETMQQEVHETMQQEVQLLDKVQDQELYARD